MKDHPDRMIPRKGGSPIGPRYDRVPADLPPLVGGSDGVDGSIAVAHRLYLSAGETTGTQVISEADWTNRELRWHIWWFFDVDGYGPYPPDSVFWSGELGASRGNGSPLDPEPHDYVGVVWCGKDTGAGWHTICDPVGWALEWVGGNIVFQIDDDTGNLRWSWSNWSASGQEIWAIVTVWAGPARTSNDYP